MRAWKQLARYRRGDSCLEKYTHRLIPGVAYEPAHSRAFMYGDKRGPAEFKTLKEKELLGGRRSSNVLYYC